VQNQQPIARPEKARELHDHRFDSTILNDFRVQRYEPGALAELGPECARWLSGGR